MNTTCYKMPVSFLTRKYKFINFSKFYVETDVFNPPKVKEPHLRIVFMTKRVSMYLEVGFLRRRN